MSRFKGTPGPWYPPHICDKTTSCNCLSVVEKNYAGGICRITLDNGKSISDGGNDGPPLDEAIANARAIAAVPEMIAALTKIRDANSMAALEGYADRATVNALFAANADATAALDAATKEETE